MKVPLFVVFAVAFAFASDIPVEGGVYVLGDSTFDGFVSSNTYVLAEFYAPWCGHCKSLEPQYSAAATELQGSDIKLAKVDATINNQIAQKFNVRGYPTLRFFVDGQSQEYDGPRDSAGIVAWLKRKTQPPAKLETVDEFETLKNSEELLVLGVFKDLSSTSATAFLQAAKKIEAAIATTTSQDVRKHLSLSDEDQVVLLKKYDNLRDNLGPVGTAEELFVKVSSHGRRLITPFTEQYQQAIFAPQNTRIAFAVSDHQDVAGTEKDLACVSVVAKKFREQVVFVDVDSSSPSTSRVLNYFGLEASSKSALVIYEPNINGKYRFTGSGLCDGLESWVENYVNGKVDQFLKTQDTPADWDAQPVKVLTGHNFEQVALDLDKYVFVKFYAPWCGHCKSLAPIWDELAEYFKDRSDIVIAKVDSTLNELKGINIQGYPTLKWFNKENEIMDYSGDRDYESLKKYVEEHTK